MSSLDKTPRPKATLGRFTWLTRSIPSTKQVKNSKHHTYSQMWRENECTLVRRLQNYLYSYIVQGMANGLVLPTLRVVFTSINKQDKANLIEIILP